jgi:hypothetical protein
MKQKIIRSDDIARCPRRSLLPGHYREDGTCLCCKAESEGWPCIRDAGHSEQPHRDRNGREWGWDL